MGKEMVAEGQYLAVFNSTHRVLKAEGILKSRNLPIMLIPAPRAVQTECGLAIRFDEASHPEIMKILENENLLPAFLCQLQNNTYLKLKEFKQ